MCAAKTLKLNKVDFNPQIASEITVLDNKRNSFTEIELIRGLAISDKRCLEALYDMYCGSLFGIIKRILKEDEVAEDVLQETFVRIWQSFRLYDSSKGRLFTWMANLARNLALDKLKSKSYRNSTLNDKLCDLELTVDHQFQIKCNPETIGVREMVLSLKPEHKAIVDLVYYRGFTHAEAAEELNIPIGTLKTRMRMAVNHLRKFFN